MENLSNLIFVCFILTTLITVLFFYLATKNAKALLLILLYMAITAALGLTGFYRVKDAIPPRFIFFPIGIILVIIFSFSKKGNELIKSINSKWMILIHVVRIPVEIIFFYLFLAKLIPIQMTFEGYNLDILSGISALVVFYLTVIKQKFSRRGLVVWNVICLALLLNILTIAIFSAQTPFQKMAFDQPNIAITFFPFVWLPTIIVPIVLISHIAHLKLLLNNPKKNKLVFRV